MRSTFDLISPVIMVALLYLLNAPAHRRRIPATAASTTGNPVWAWFYPPEIQEVFIAKGITAIE
jgi:hypothetical protein